MESNCTGISYDAFGALPRSKSSLPAKGRKLFNKHVGSSAWWNALTSQGASISPDEFIDSWNEAARDFRIQNNQYLY